MQQLQRDLDPVSLEQVVRFAGAVQDFNPIHYDQSFALAAGLPGVIAQGPLTYLLALDALIAANGPSRLGAFAARLKAPVLPGMPLSIRCDEQGMVSLNVAGREALAGTVMDAEGAVR